MDDLRLYLLLGFNGENLIHKFSQNYYHKISRVPLHCHKTELIQKTGQKVYAAGSINVGKATPFLHPYVFFLLITG